MAPSTVRRVLRVGAIAAFVVVPLSADNPPAPGFDEAGSDATAIAIADEVMAAMGGREAWDTTRYVSWNFFGRRRHLWDRLTGDVRIEGVDRETEVPYLVLMNLHTKEGRAFEGGTEVEGEGLADFLERGESAWINDSYWLVMPYKLKDSGVTLEFVGPGTMVDGRSARVLQLTFREVGRTPENRYLVYVADDSGLVEQWDFFSERGDEEPRFQTPWHDWKRHGEILLSADRGENSHTDVCVLDDLPPQALTDPAPVDWQALLSDCSGGG